MFFALGALLAMTYPFVFHAGNESLLSYLLSVTATMVVLAVAEWPRRYVAALLAPVVLGISLTLFVTSADCSACVHVRALTRVGVICAGVFLWATMADLAVTIGSRAVFTVGLASVVVSLALGLAAGRVLGGAEVGARLVGYGLTVTALLTAGALGSIAIGGSVWSSPPSSVPLGASVDLVARSLQNRASNSRQSSSRSVLGDRDVIVHRLKAFGLSDREIEVAVPLVHGQKWEEIAETLNISRNTLKSHVRSIYRKTGARNRQGLLLHVLNDDPHEPQ
jgi:DNA-binding CsgD family transcriptional regulator